MKKYGFLFILLAGLLLIVNTTASATSYTIGYNDEHMLINTENTFSEDFALIDSATLSFRIKGFTTSGPYVFDSIVDISAGSTSMPNKKLADAWEDIDLSLNTATINMMKTNDELSFSILGQDVVWWGGNNYPLKPSRFYLDKATLDVASSSAPAPVPEPGTALLLGSALLGMAIVWRRKRS